MSAPCSRWPVVAAAVAVLVFVLSAGRAPSDAFYSRLAHGRGIARHGLSQADAEPGFIGRSPWRAPTWGFDLAAHATASVLGAAPAAALVRGAAIAAFCAAVAAAGGAVAALPLALAVHLVADLAALPETELVPLGFVSLFLALRALGARSRWLIALMVVWANMDGSVVLGLALIAAAPGVAWRQRLVGVATAAAATLLNPHGPRIYDPRAFWPSRALITLCPDWHTLDFREPGPMVVAVFVAATALLALLARDKLGRGQRVLWLTGLMLLLTTRAGLPIFVGLSTPVYAAAAQVFDVSPGRRYLAAGLGTAALLLGALYSPVQATPVELPLASLAALPPDTAILHPVGFGGRVLDGAAGPRVFPACQPGTGDDATRAEQAALLRPEADAWRGAAAQFGAVLAPRSGPLRVFLDRQENWRLVDKSRDFALFQRGERVPQEDSAPPRDLDSTAEALAAADREIARHNLWRAAWALRSAIHASPDEVTAHERLARVWRELGRDQAYAAEADWLSAHGAGRP